MRILIFNWKDIKHPLHGGAEIATQRFAEELVKRKHTVTLFTSKPGRLKNEEVINGVSIIRRGNSQTVYFYACLFYLTKLKAQTDLIIDQIHGIPFFTCFYVKKPILAYIHEIAADIWFKTFPFPIALLGKLFEPVFLSWYKHIPFLCDSPSTAYELQQRGIVDTTVIPLTIDSSKKYKHFNKTAFTSIVYIGSISEVKQIDLLVEAMSILKNQFPAIRLYLGGRAKPQQLTKIKNSVEKLNLTKQIQILGEVSEREKYKYYSQSWLHVQPSLKEGFGLTVLEAASVKTPTICFNVPGLAESVGKIDVSLVVPEMTAQSLAQTITTLLNNPQKIKQLSDVAYQWSKGLPTWEQQTKRLEHLLMRLTSSRNLYRLC